MADPTPTPGRRHARRERKANPPGKTPIKGVAEPKPPAMGAAPAAKPAEPKRKARGVVCPKCGKYHDVTSKPIGSEFACYCGQAIVVPPPLESGAAAEHARQVRLAEWRKRKNLTALGMAAAFALSIFLISAAIYLVAYRGALGQAFFTAFLGLGFLIAGGFASGEHRRIKVEIAGEMAE